ncbi:hypothetical protein SARC_01084 [Sphaeroforma arctica JP610]|uniref:CSC1/OSCA1-like 7TM region domain-containing protein n=1 Tax=Sphaeroforma arctica JP610 TaxID=667725 RepID=A0A0L0GD25_9EUKA|nr:hypothetical protein SARC_01084 [Sphaeroforma arctica JP610]KNC86791.1 hypothetical protein SARC_01084 [Sphaeroforma arctica JP610]|eukprot:XP_014160693.1 hypothetical protein SARC_01084 [Sphaeroforma arctica JP610]
MLTGTNAIQQPRGISSTPQSSTHSVDSIQYYAEEVKKLNQQISARQMEIKNKYTLYGYDIEVTSAAMANPLTMTRRRSSSSTKGTNRLQRKPSKAAQLLQRRYLTKEDTPRLTPTQRLQLLREQSHTEPVHTYSSATGTSFGGDSGFVMFKSHRAATMAVQCVPGSSLPGYHLVQAPDPSAVIWSNISHHNAYRFSTWITIWAAFIALTIVFTIPAATLASLTSLENISKIFPILNDICKNYPTIKGLLEGVLPQISIIAFYLVMPYVLYALGHFEGHLCWGDLELSVVRKWFMFQAVNVFLAPAVSASIIQTFNAAQKDISHIPELLGRAIPSASTFFINYAILRTCLTQVTEILRLGAVAYTYTGYWTSQTPRDRDAAKDPGRVMYGDILSRTLVLFLIGASYAVLAPLILPFVTLFFAASLFVWKYQLTYVYISQMDTGGLFWFVSFRRIIFSTIFAQITVFGIFSLKQSLAGVLVLPLPFISYGVLYYYTKWWKQRALFLTLDEAMRADLIVLSNQEGGNTNVTQLADYGDMYLQPILTGKPMYPRLTEQFVADDDDSQNELTPEVAQLMRELAENDIAIDEIVDEEQPLLVSPE